MNYRVELIIKLEIETIPFLILFIIILSSMQHYYNYLPRCANASQLIPYSNTNDPMKDLVGLHQLTLLLGDDGMKHVLYNLLIGNQVIVRGDHSYMIHRIVRILKVCCYNTRFLFQNIAFKIHSNFLSENRTFCHGVVVLFRNKPLIIYIRPDYPPR